MKWLPAMEMSCRSDQLHNRPAEPLLPAVSLRPGSFDIRPVIFRVPVNQLTIGVNGRSRRRLIDNKLERGARLSDPNLFRVQQLLIVLLSLEDPNLDQVVDRNLRLD